jgi:hypothetical protein
MRFVLSRFDHPGKNPNVVGSPDPLIVGSAADALDDNAVIGLPRRELGAAKEIPP